MPCEHLQHTDLIKLAEEHLNKKKISAAEWEGYKFTYLENVDIWGAKSIFTEIVRRENNWVTTAIDRRKEEAPESKTGFRSLAPDS